MIPALQVPYYPICSIYVQLSGILRNRKVTLCLSKALKQTCYCLLHMSSVKTLEVTLGDSYHCLFFSIEQSAIMENVVVQIPKMLTKQFNREMLSLKKKLCCEMIVSVFHVLCPYLSLQSRMPGTLFPSMHVQNRKPVIILPFNINYSSIRHDELMWHYVAFRCTPKGLWL